LLGSDGRTGAFSLLAAALQLGVGNLVASCGLWDVGWSGRVERGWEYIAQAAQHRDGLGAWFACCGARHDSRCRAEMRSASSALACVLPTCVLVRGPWSMQLGRVGLQAPIRRRISHLSVYPTQKAHPKSLILSRN
jgi:hypothetical protein